jgi:hypothetical protein
MEGKEKERQEKELALYRKELAALSIDPSNPYMRVLEPLLCETDEPLRNCIRYYESILGKLDGKKGELVARILSDLKKKI